MTPTTLEKTAVAARGRVLANSIPKSGTHLLLRLFTELGYGLVDFGGPRPSPVDGREGRTFERLVRSVAGAREPGRFLGVGPHLVTGGRVPGLRRFLRDRGPEKVVLGVESPKEIGRRWLERRFGNVPQGSVVSAHCSYSDGFGAIARSQDLKVVCLARDPRDTAVSHMHYLKKLPRHPAYREYLALPDDHARLMFSIRGGELGGHRILPMGERYRDFLDWERRGGAALVRFEDLVGPKGGGSEEAQRRAVGGVVRHLGLEVGEGRLAEIRAGLFGSGRTFRKGRSGGWRNEFSGGHKAAVKEQAQDVLERLGYEEDAGW